MVGGKDGQVQETAAQQGVEVEGEELALHQAEGVPAHPPEKDEPCGGKREAVTEAGEFHFRLSLGEELDSMGGGVAVSGSLEPGY